MEIKERASKKYLSKFSDIVIDYHFILSLPPSCNHAYLTTRAGRRILTQEARTWKTRTGYLAKQVMLKHKLEMITEKFYMKIWVYWKDKRRRDCDNILKLLLDSMEKIVYNDDMYCIPQFQDFEICKDNPRLVVNIIKKEE